MPKEIRTAYLDIIQSNEIYPVDVLKIRYQIEDEVIKSCQLLPDQFVFLV